jgi:hypothetical protein
MNITETIKNLVRLYISEGIPLSKINEGYCADFATFIYENVAGAEIWNDEELGSKVYTHTFIKYKGLYYDAEAPEGVKQWIELPIFQRNAEPCPDKL